MMRPLLLALFLVSAGGTALLAADASTARVGDVWVFRCAFDQDTLPFFSSAAECEQHKAILTVVSAGRTNLPPVATCQCVRGVQHSPGR